MNLQDTKDTLALGAWMAIWLVGALLACWTALLAVVGVPVVVIVWAIKELLP